VLCFLLPGLQPQILRQATRIARTCQPVSTRAGEQHLRDALSDAHSRWSVKFQDSHPATSPHAPQAVLLTAETPSHIRITRTVTTRQLLKMSSRILPPQRSSVITPLGVWGGRPTSVTLCGMMTSNYGSSRHISTVLAPGCPCHV